MHIEDYFDYCSPNDIRLKGTRVGIETILYAYLYRHQSPESIARKYRTLQLEQVYATILFYLHNKSEMDVYLEEWIRFGQQMRNEQRRNPPAVLQKLLCGKQQESNVSG